MAHVVDGNTVHLWRMNDVGSFASFLSAADSGANGITLTAARATAPRVVKGPRGTGYARVFNGTDHELTRTSGAGAAAATLQGSWTARFWFKVDSLSAINCLFAYGTDGETLATNIQGSVQVSTGGKMFTFWEHTGGVNVQTTQVAGSAITANTWYGGAVVKDGGNVKFYLWNENGTAVGGNSLQDTIAHGTAPTGGTTAIWTIGADLPSHTARFIGAIGSMEILNTALSQAQLNADMASTTFTASVNTYALWNFQEPPEAIDETGNMHLCVNGTGNFGQGTGPLLNGETGFSFVSTGGCLEFAYANIAANTSLITLLQSANYTIEFQFNYSINVVDFGFICTGTPGSETAANNTLCFSITTALIFYAFSESGVGVDSTHTTALPVLSFGSTFGKPHYGAVVKNSGAHKFYIDGVEVASWTFGSNLTSGAGAPVKLPFNVVSSGTPATGVLSDFRISNIARSPTAIADYYAALTAPVEPENSTTYVMRGYDTTLNEVVYWRSSEIDNNASDYEGPGPINSVVLSNVVGECECP